MAREQQDEGQRGGDWLDAPYAKTVVLGVAWNWICTVYGRGTFAHVTFTLLSFYFIGIPLALFGFIFDCCYKKKGPRSKQWLSVLWRVVLLVFLQVFHLECGQYLLQQDVAAAQAHCEGYMLPLDEYMREHGSYPVRLSQLPFYQHQLKAEEADKTNAAVPWLLQERSGQGKGERDDFYAPRNGGQEYQFYFNDPADIGTQQYIYTSVDKEWKIANKTDCVLDEHHLSPFADLPSAER